MDPFTQRILQKAEQRSKTLGVSKLAKYPFSEVNEKKLSNEINTVEVERKSKSTSRTPTKVLRQFALDKENSELGIEINITTASNVEVQVEVEEHDIMSSADTCAAAEHSTKLRESSRNRLQRLGALYSNTDILSSPIYRTEEKFHENKDEFDTQLKKPIQKSCKLIALANSIKNWEDDTTSHSVDKKSQFLAKPSSPIKDSHQVTEDTNNAATSTKKLKWDKNVMDSLQAQGFQKRESSTTKYSYEYKNKCKMSENTESDLKKIDKDKIAPKITNFEKKTFKSPKKNEKDPAEMSLKERMLLFEKNKGQALVPKAAFGMAAPIKNSCPNNMKKLGNVSTIPAADGPINKTKDGGSNVKDRIAALTSGVITSSEKAIRDKLLKEKQHDMNILARRYVSNEVNIPEPPPLPQVNNSKGTQKRRSPCNNCENTTIATDEKRAKTSSNRLYPVLSDLESTDSEIDNYTTATVSTSSPSIDDNLKNNKDCNESFGNSEDDDSADISNASLGREIMKVVQSNESCEKAKRKEVRYANENAYYGNSSINSLTSEGSGIIDDYLDEALEENDSDSDNDLKEKSANGTKSSNSFSYKKQLVNNLQSPQKLESSTHRNFEGPVRSELSVNNSEDDNMVTLVHTVSFYRKQQSSNNSTPVRKVVYEKQERIEETEDNVDEQFEDDNSEKEDNDYKVQDKIKKLLDEVCKQQQVIGQTSQALNLCASTIEFSGSTESVEGERHLLVATHRRQACLDEIQRLRVENTIRPRGSSKEKGLLTIKEITIPLREDYTRKLSTDAISGHHLVCLLKYNERILATKTVPTLPGLSAVKFPDTLSIDNVYDDFRITLEIYGMTAQREVLPHEVKYHIALNKKGMIKTPKKKNIDSKLIMPMVQSPAGPNAVRTPALVQYGFAIFSLREIQRKTWTLNQVSSNQFSRVSPLGEYIHMKINCELTVSIEYKGFLTMFEDMSGFGAWHRRWCYLNGYVLSYWKYPDDEKKKAPIGSIDFHNCCSSKITTAPRDICARLNTMLVECQRPARENDVETLLTIPGTKNTKVRYLLSADTKEERNQWCSYFTKVLTLLRAWEKYD